MTTSDPSGKEAGAAGDQGVVFSPLDLADAIERHYPRLRGMMRARLAQLVHIPAAQLTSPPTALANEVVERLIGQHTPFRDAEHMMAVASVLTVRVIRDAIRRRRRLRRGGGNRGEALPSDLPAGDPDSHGILDHGQTMDALERLAREDPRRAEVATLRSLGLTTPQVADAMNVSTATVERDYRLARAWLRVLMEEDTESSGVR